VTYRTIINYLRKNNKDEIKKVLDFRDYMISKGFEPDVRLIGEIHKAIEEPWWW
jgi:pentatricopeptide repeat protein